ncbi:MAG: sirohydrochlorin chelatase [Pseudomonadota bacterium]
MAKKGIMICGHGSRAKSAEQEFGLLAAGLKRRYPDTPVEHGFLEYSAPNIHMGLDALRDAGVTEIIAVPGMLFAATHAKNDIPSVLTTYQERNPGLTVRYGRELGLHPQMIAAFQARILEALKCDHVHDGDLYDTMLVVVGRGTSDTWANAEAARLTRVVAENMGFGWAETVYSGVTFPSVGRGLELLTRLGFSKIVVAPYFLFTGRLIDRIYGYVDRVAEANSEIQFLKAHYLADQDHVIDTFVARIEEASSASIPTTSNLMASFTERSERGELEVHHHHAEYRDPLDDEQLTGHSHDHDDAGDHHLDDTHAGGHSHHHGHSHGTYKHIAHPHGPRSMIDQGVCCCFMSQFPEGLIEEERLLRAQFETVQTAQKPDKASS